MHLIFDEDIFLSWWMISARCFFEPTIKTRNIKGCSENCILITINVMTSAVRLKVLHAMLTKHAFKLERIFVGRKDELEILELMWEECLRPSEHQVHVLLNAPGIGKTRLLQQFGESLVRRGAGLYFHYQCDSRFQSTSALNRSLIESLGDLLLEKITYIEEYIRQHHSPRQQERKLRVLNNLIELADNMDWQQKITLDDTVSFIIKLSTVIPLFFVADEIQEFQKQEIFIDEMNAKSQDSSLTETALHHFTRILKSLTRARILMVLSGTQYHILSQIGTKIGSPIAQKVQQIVIKNFTPVEVDEYVRRVNDLIIRQMIPRGKETVAVNLLASYRQFLHAFSGGHPRTISLITQWFLAEFPKIVTNPPSHEDFIKMLFQHVERDFKQRILTTEKQNHVTVLQTHEAFPVVKEWLVNAATKGFALGSAPPAANEQEKAEIEDLIYQLMTLGIIVKNGWDQYHVTSYFHLLAFLESLNGQFEQFLSQVLSNQFFQLLCGSHSGFG